MDISRYRVDGSKPIKLANYTTERDDAFIESESEQEYLDRNTARLDELQERLAAAEVAGVLVIIQGMDASGKDGCIRSVFSGLNPYGVAVHSFKSPTAQELAHDYLWRLHQLTPPRGMITVFNRSYYEDVLIVKVHKLYQNLKILDRVKNDDLIETRYRQIVEYERYLWENAVVVVKVMLHVSKDQQARRFIRRVEDPTRNWKFNIDDILEREFWDDYQKAYQKCINNTASKIAPWYIVPADYKPYARAIVSEIVLATLESLNPQFPKMTASAYEDLELGHRYLMGDKGALKQVRAIIEKKR